LLVSDIQRVGKESNEFNAHEAGVIDDTEWQPVYADCL
jgi:hypothetical protein